jgi:adenine-specific DNA-methyltransferase
MRSHIKDVELKMKRRKEIDEIIQQNAPQESRDERLRILRVSGPFTVETIPVISVDVLSLAPIPQFEKQVVREHTSDRCSDYLANMINLLKQQGEILFPCGNRLEVRNLSPINLGYLHAEAESSRNGKTLRVAVSFGLQHGPILAHQVQEAIPTVRMNGYNVLIFVGFAFDPEAQALIQKMPEVKVIDFEVNEVMRVVSLDGGEHYAI